MSAALTALANIAGSLLLLAGLLAFAVAAVTSAERL